jgi:hypothetical protein
MSSTITTLANVALFFAFPWVLNKAVAFFRKDKAPSGPVIPPTPRTRMDRFVSVCILCLMAFYAFRAYVPLQPNFFQVVNAPYDAQNWYIRNQFRDYADQRREWDPTFEAPRPGLIPAKLASAPGPEGLPSSGAEQLSEYHRMHALYELLKTSSNRFTYLTFGEDAFLYCTWCKDTYDYFLYIMPSILEAYCVMVLCVGLITLNKRRAFWRSWAVGFLVVASSLDLTIFLIPEEHLFEVIGHKNVCVSSYADRSRNAVFAALLLVMWLIDSKNTRSELDMVKTAVSHTEAMFSNFQATKIQKAVIVDDPELFKQSVEYQKKIKAERGSAIDNLRLRPATAVGK